MTDKQAPESRGTEARKAFDELLNAGMQLANCAFNLKDRAEALTDREKSILAECQARWDRAVQTRGDIRLALLATQRSTEPAVRGDAEALRDAQRYRWLRERSVIFYDDPDEADNAAPAWADILDRRVDAALAQTPEGKDET